jgi:hypothetical protein
LADNDTDISLPVVSYVWHLSTERFPELTQTCTHLPWSFGMLNVCDEPPAVGTLAWSVCPFSVVMDMPTAEIPNRWEGTLTVSP